MAVNNIKKNRANKMKAMRFFMTFFAILVVTAGPVLALDQDQGTQTIEQPRSKAAGATRMDHQEPTPKTCPHTRYIDCMPPVPQERRAMCTREYLEWVKNNCPGVKVVY